MSFSIELDSTTQVAELSRKLNSAVKQTANDFSAKHKVLGRLSGLPVGMIIGSIVAVQAVARVVECVAKGVINLIGGVFNASLNSKLGVSQLTKHTFKSLVHLAVAPFYVFGFPVVSTYQMARYGKLDFSE